MMASTGSRSPGSFHALCVDLLSTSDHPAERLQASADALVIAATVGRRQGRTLSASGSRLSGADLSGVDLRAGVHLQGVFLDHADLTKANLAGADLCGANLNAADLRGATLDGARLRDATLVGADLRGASLAHADLQGAVLDDAKLFDTVVTGADLRGASLSGTGLPTASLDYAHFSVADFMALAGPSTPSAVPAPPVPDTGGSEPARRPTVLIVDEEPDLLDMMARMLERSGFHALSAGDAAQAISLCREHPGPIDVLLTDLVLSDTSGVELVRQAAALRSGLRVVYQSGLPQDIAVAKGLVGRDAHFLKTPVTSRSLTDALWTVLSEDQWVH